MLIKNHRKQNYVVSAAAEVGEVGVARDDADSHAHSPPSYHLFHTEESFVILVVSSSASKIF